MEVWTFVDEGRGRLFSIWMHRCLRVDNLQYVMSKSDVSVQLRSLEQNPLRAEGGLTGKRRVHNRRDRRYDMIQQCLMSPA